MSQHWSWWLPPGLYLAGAGWAALTTGRPWRAVATATSMALALQCVLSSAALAGIPLAPGAPGAVPIVAALVSFLGWLIARYSARYLEGEPGQWRYAIALLATLGSVNAVVVSTDLRLLIASWVLSSVGLHHLLTFYSDRAPAIVVAHKKFLASRLAELCFVAAAALLYREWGTLDLASIADHARSLQTAGAGLTAAGLLLALGAILKSAQLPLHGWLIQVMEAPTPVSALLHAGIVNLGGFVMIRLAPLMSQVAAAQVLLVLVGSLTAVLGGLVMMTRISVKVRLAWSTCSQMGFMLMECGLGLYDLALLHLVGHSFYKAYAFLSAGEVVNQTRRRALRAPVAGDARGSLARRMFALPIAFALVLGSALAWERFLHAAPVPLVALLVVAAGLASLFWEPGSDPGRTAMRNALTVLVLAQLYLGWHHMAGALVGIPPGARVSAPIGAWVGLCFIGSYALQAILASTPDSRLWRTAYAWVYGGFYLDERFTRLTFRFWPAKLEGRDDGLTKS